MWTNTERPDLLVTMSKSGETQMRVYKLTDNQTYEQAGEPITILKKTQPFVADIDGDYR